MTPAPRRKHLDYDVARRLFALATANGAARLSVSHCHWDLSEDCENAVHIEYAARPYLDAPSGTFLHVEMFARCRSCQSCLQARQRVWATRALRETAMAFRTWFGTLTLRPEAQYAAYAQAAHRLALHGQDIDKLPQPAQFLQRHKSISKEITRYVKRVRKSSGLLRVLLVAEAHKSGLPHYHMLIHERDLKGTRKETLDAQWKLGFTRWRLIAENRQATYLCKYLGKELAARVRASKLYGNQDLSHSALEIMRVTTNDPQRVVYGASGHICADGGRSPKLAMSIGDCPKE